jgi:hypothetical protein
MSMPRVPLPLPPAEARCSSETCPRTSACARRRAQIDQGSPLQDYSIDAGWSAPVCGGWVDLGTLARRTATPPQPPRRFPYPTQTD